MDKLKDNLTFKNYFLLLNKMISKEIINIHEYIGNKYSRKEGLSSLQDLYPCKRL